MTDSAAQVNRIVQLVAELSRRERDGEPALRIADVAAQFGVSPADVSRDIRTLTAMNGDAEHDWLGSLSVIQEGDEIALSSQGPFRRPVRLTPEELLAIQVALADDEAAPALTSELSELLGLAEQPVQVSASESSGPDEGRVLDLARRAAEEHRCLDLLYVGSADHEPERRVAEVHQVVSAGGKFYLISWCRLKGGQRHFRADRVLEARLLDERFTPRAGFTPLESPDAVFDASAGAERVTVRIAPGIARWVGEQFPEAVREGDGSLLLDYPVSDPSWLVRTVLQYGADAEVVSPEAYRDLVRAAVQAG